MIKKSRLSAVKQYLGSRQSDIAMLDSVFRQIKPVLVNKNRHG